MREHNSNYHNGAGFFVAVFSCLLAVLVTGSIGSNFSKQSSTSVLGSSIKTRHTKQLRAIAFHHTKRVCAKPRSGFIACMADISIGANGQPLTGTPANSGALGPQQFHTAYNLPCTPGGLVASTCSTPSSFGPETIAIVDAGNFSSGAVGLETSMHNYDQYYGLPECTIASGCLNVVNQNGATSPLPAPSGGWDDEIALDVETAHMICQSCKIVLVESNNAYVSNLAIAEVTAASFNPVSISNSWGDTTDEPFYDPQFRHDGIAVVAATGDAGSVSSGASWPADNPYVVAVSGTTLQLNTDNTWASESLWSGSGGGCSNYYPTPSWQLSLANWSTAGCGSHRSFGDVSADADPNTGAAINVNGSWFEVGGTSLSSPIIAGVYALSGGLPNTSIGSSLPYASFSTSNFHDIISGNNCTSINITHCNTGIGFDTPTGLGSPNGINGFASLPTQPTLTATVVDQSHVNLSWTASTATLGISGYRIYRNGSLIATVSTTSYSDTGLTANTNYSYYVVAIDSNGILSIPSSTVSGFSAYPADINKDGHVDLLDLSNLANKYGQCGSGLGSADINNDGCVDLLDLSLLASRYGSE